jgi:hypothetical protein
MAFKSLQINKLYIKLFDVDWNRLDGPYPVSVSEFPSESGYYGYHPFLEKVDKIPVIFITNRTLENTDLSDIKTLSRKICRKTWIDSSRLRKNSYVIGNLIINELQIDCDWTAATKEKYFSLIKEIRTTFPGLKISATIRLYQLANPKLTGVPPVDRGMLMYYNMTEPRNIKTKNSIIDNDEGKKYLRKASTYPIPLDVALPLFSWGAVFRSGSFNVLMHDMTENEANHLPFLKNEQYNVFRCTADTVYHNEFLREGDRIRIEQASEVDLEKAANFTSQYIKNDSLTVSFFAWDSTAVKRYGQNKIENIYHSY